MTTLETVEHGDVFADNGLTAMSLVEAALSAGVNGVIRERHGENRLETTDYEITSLDEGNSVGLLRISCSDGRGRGTQSHEAHWDSGTSNDADRWAIIKGKDTGDDEETVTPPTAFEFLSELAAGTKIFGSLSSISSWVFMGIKYLNDERVIALYGLRRNDIHFIPQSDWDVENGWKTHEEVEYVSDTERFAINVAVDERISRLNVDAGISKLRTEVITLRNDFITVNEKINDYAEQQGMCSDYERRIYGWNSDLTEMKLYGRMKPRVVYLKIPELFGETRVYMEIEARSAGDAQELVKVMEHSKIIELVSKSGFAVQNMSFTVEDPYNEAVPMTPEEQQG